MERKKKAISKKEADKAMKNFKNNIKKFEGTGIRVGNGISLGSGHPHYKIANDVLAIKGKKNEDGSVTLTKSQLKQVNNYRNEDYEEECPACEGTGVVGCDYCDVCWGKRKVTVKRRIKIE